MKPIDEDLLNEIQPLDDAVLDELATALTAAAAVAQELKSDWQPRQLEATLRSLEDAIKRAWGALSRAESHARSARKAANRCWECGSPLEYDANGSRWCPNTDCKLGQIASRHRLLITDYSKLGEKLLDRQQRATEYEVDVDAHSESRNHTNDALA